MSKISIRRMGVTKLRVDAVVNAANEYLWEGGGVCGAIFVEAGSDQLTRACQRIGHCDTGSAVITPGFRLRAKYIIHAVGPRYIDGHHNEAQLLYGAYASALALARDNECHSIGFPLISAGIFEYPKKEAFQIAIQACRDFIREEDYDIDISFAVLDPQIAAIGMEMLGE